MKKMIFALSAGALALVAAPAAFATTYSPAGTNVTFTGSLTLSQSTTLTCNTSLTVAINGAGTSASVTGGSVSPGSWQCLFVYPTFSPAWSITATAPASGTVTNLDIGNVRAVSLTGTCGADTLEVLWNDASNTITIPSQSISGSPGPCTFSGSLTTGTNVTITN